MDDIAQDVNVAAGGHRSKSSLRQGAAVDHVCRVEDRPSALDDVRLVEEEAAQSRVPLEDRGEQPAMSAPDIDRQPHGEVIRRRDEARVVGRVAGHARVEQGCHFRVSGEIVEEAHAVDVVERGLAGTDSVEQMTPRSPVRFVEQEQDGWPQGARHARPQSDPNRGQGEAARPDLVEDSDLRAPAGFCEGSADETRSPGPARQSPGSIGQEVGNA